MDLGLEGKVAWVTGASSGLGRATAEALAAEGARVAVSARRAAALEEVIDSIRSSGGVAAPFPLDVTDARAIPDVARRVASELGAVDILVSNSGGPPPGGFEDLVEDELRVAFELTTASAWRLTKAVLPGMKDRGRGCLLYITSGSTKEVIPDLLLSNMMRAAVVGMAKTLSKELGPNGIRALCVAPGRIQTARVEELDRSAADKTGRSEDEVKRGHVAAIPLGRYGDPKEFGEVVAFLASERASYISGVSVSVDGGQLDFVLA
ncbi:MAG TPA: SDR family oxidoreductase [Actinomycetota bacterium]|nr:SDR family oxidoreductase [Actinomycetota bacterium]